MARLGRRPRAYALTPDGEASKELENVCFYLY
jgi:hypothetical protein